MYSIYITSKWLRTFYIKSRWLRTFIAALVLLAGWALISHFSTYAQSLLPPPERVISRMFERDFASTYALIVIPNSLAWVLLAWALGFALTGFLSIASRSSPFIKSMLDLLFIGGRTLPSVIAVPLFAAILGLDRGSAICCSVFLVISYSHPAFEESLGTLAQTKSSIREAIGLSKFHEFVMVILPGVASAWKAISVQSLGIALVVSIAGEMILSFPNSVGDEVSDMIWLNRTVDLYSVICWLVISVGLIRWGVELIPGLFELPGRRLVRRIYSESGINLNIEQAS